MWKKKLLEHQAAGRFRHELKYEVPIKTANELFDDCMPFCQWDKHAGPTKMYEIASIYYDTPTFIFYRDREESVGYRRKVRLRSYNHDGKSKALFIEIKEKHKHFVNKKRINMKTPKILDTCPYPHYKIPLSFIIENLEDSAEKREIEYLHNRYDLQPVTIIRYFRKALVPLYEDDMRITLDVNITSGAQTLDKHDPEHEKAIIHPTHGVLEIKSNKAVPLWLNSVLQKYGVSQVRYSKYCLGVDEDVKRTPLWVPSKDTRDVETVEAGDVKAAG